VTHNNYPITPPLAPAETSTLPDWVTNPPILLIIATATVALAVLITAAALTARLVRRIRRPAEDMLTLGVAALATGVSAQGMWRFFEDKLGIDGPLRIMLFAFIELAVAASAIRARRNMRDTGSAGIDGIAVWALAGLTATLSAMDARSTAEALFRLAAPLVAAWLWERGMAVERRRITGRKRINWRITPERILVRLGLAEATERTVGEVDTQRRITLVALAAERLRYLRTIQAAHWRIRLATWRLRRRYTAAALNTGIAGNTELQAALRREVAGLLAVDQLADIQPLAAWSQADQPRPVDDHSATATATAGDVDASTGRDRGQDVTATDQLAVSYTSGRRGRTVRWADAELDEPTTPTVPVAEMPTATTPAATGAHDQSDQDAATAGTATDDTAWSELVGQLDSHEQRPQSDHERGIEIIDMYYRAHKTYPSKRRLADELGPQHGLTYKATWWHERLKDVRAMRESAGSEPALDGSQHHGHG